MSQKSWTCKGVSLESNNKVLILGWVTFCIFITLAMFLLAATYISVIGIENIDLTARLLLYWNPVSNPFVWVLVAMLGISVALILIGKIVKASCEK